MHRTIDTAGRIKPGNSACSVVLAILLALLGGSSAAAQERAEAGTEAALEQGSSREGVDLSRIRGVNYVPSYASSSYQAWMEYDGETVRRELSAAAKIGFNSVRVWLSYSVYERRPTPFLAHFSDLIEACRAEGLSIMPVLFDATGVDPINYGTGTETVREAYRHFLSRPEAYQLHPAYARYVRVIAEELIPEMLIPATRDPGVIFWGEWTPSPSFLQLGMDDRERCADYLRAVIEPFKDDPIVVAWDIMNEPNAIGVFTSSPPPLAARDFVMAMIRAARELEPSQPLTVGTAGGHAGARGYVLQEDIISLHIYQKSAGELVAEVREAKRQNGGKPILLTGGGAILFPASLREASEDFQEDMLHATLIAVESERIGYYLWHLIEGKMMTPWTALLRSDESLKPAALWLQKKFRPGR